MEREFIKRWRIVATEVWGDDSLDLLGPAYIQLKRAGQGSIQVGALQADLDWRYRDDRGRGQVEFSWVGDDDGEPVSGRGWAVIGDGCLQGELFIHRGDSSRFSATPPSQS